MSHVPEDLDLRKVDFDALYQGGQMIEGVDPGVPWDIGAAQPVVIEAERAGRLHGDVLDVGCGQGDNAVYLAGQGHRVTGIDTSPSAIEEARRRARQRGVDILFAVADASSLVDFENRFDSVLDGACYHCLDEDARLGYVAALHRATRGEALLSLFCFAPGASGPVAAMGIPEENLRTAWSEGGWHITDLRLVRYHITAAVREMATAFGFQWEPVPNEPSRLQIPIWSLQAQRRKG